jgi:hypothetical protein
MLHVVQWVFLPEPTIRKQLVLPPPVKVDYRAACFCHRELIDIGFVCSVCLSSKSFLLRCHGEHTTVPLPSTLFCSDFPSKLLYVFSFFLCMLHVPPHLIPFDFIYLVKITNYEAPHYAVFSCLLSLPPS